MTDDEEFPADRQPVENLHLCEDCGAELRTAAGLRIHRGRLHRGGSGDEQEQKPKKDRRPADGPKPKTTTMLEKDLVVSLETVAAVIGRFHPAGDALREQSKEIAASLIQAQKRYRVIRPVLVGFCEIATIGNVMVAVKPVIDTVRSGESQDREESTDDATTPDGGASALGGAGL